MKRVLRLLGWLGKHLRGRVVAGMIVVVPAVITFVVFRFLVLEIDPVLQPVVRGVVGRSIPGAGFILGIILLYVLGSFGANFIGRKMIRFGHEAISRIPIIEAVYGASKQLIDALSGTGNESFKRVVVIEYPRKGIKSLGFVTGQFIDNAGRTFVTVYIPTTPNPTSGWLSLVDESEIENTNLSVEVAMKMVLSGGVVSPAVQVGEVRTEEDPALNGQEV